MISIVFDPRILQKKARGAFPPHRLRHPAQPSPLIDIQDENHNRF